MSNPPVDPGDVSGTGGVSSGKGTPGDKQIQPDQASFKSYMNEAPSQQEAQSAQEATPMDLASKNAPQVTPTLQSLTAQVNSAQDTLGTVANQAKTQNLTMKSSQQSLLNSKLTDANQNLNSTLNQLGAKVPADTQVSDDANPLTKYLGLVTDGQNKLVAAQQQLTNLQSSGSSLQPGQLLLIQVKLSQAQQEIEYSSILLSQVVSAFKQMMNIQL